LQNGYVKDIQQSITVLNCTPSLILKAKEKLRFELQRIVGLQSDDYDPQCVNNALDVELDIFHNTLDLNALRKVMLKGDVGIYRYNRPHVTFQFIFNNAEDVTSVSSQTRRLLSRQSLRRSDQSAMYKDQVSLPDDTDAHLHSYGMLQEHDRQHNLHEAAQFHVNGKHRTRG